MVMGCSRQTFFFLILEPQKKTLEQTLEKTLENTLEKKRPQNDLMFSDIFFDFFTVSCSELSHTDRCGFHSAPQANILRILNPEMRFPKGKSIFRRSDFSKNLGIPPRVQFLVVRKRFEISRKNPRKYPIIFRLSKKPQKKTLEFFRSKTLETLENTLEKKRSDKMELR